MKKILIMILYCIIFGGVLPALLSLIGIQPDLGAIAIGLCSMIIAENLVK